jgi:hypothetical protein
VASYALDGTFAWVSTSACGGSLAVDATGAVYVAGGFQGFCFDPGSGTDMTTSDPVVPFVEKLDGHDGSQVWLNEFTSCQGALTAAAVSADGNLWVAGLMSGMCTVNPTYANVTDGVFAAFSPAGLPLFINAVPADSRYLTAAPDGSVYIGGLAAGVVDFDAGPGNATRSLPGNDGNEGGFVAKLAADGSFGWVQTLARIPLTGLAATPDSGVIAIGNAFTDGNLTGFFATRIGGDSIPAWSLGVNANGGLGLGLVAVGGSTLILVGATETGAPDVVPGPTTVPAPASSSFVLQYGF